MSNARLAPKKYYIVVGSLGCSVDETKKPSIKEFRLGAQIGVGNFSTISIATHKITSEKFALKAIEKSRVRRLQVRHQNIFNEIKMEKQVLNRLHHPNIIRLHHTFQDEGSLYFLLELLEGGELLAKLFHDKSQVGIGEELARFYLADMINALEYMHANKVIHRDLKPENMVIDLKQNGHLCLIDFGTAKVLNDTSLNGTNFVGTPEYMSPETVENKSVSHATDLWALGCILYQLLTGETPFGAGSIYLTLLRIKEGEFDIPCFISDQARDLIEKLLNRHPNERIGAGERGMDEIKGTHVAHPFLSGIDFENHQRSTAPITSFPSHSLLEIISNLSQIEKSRGKTGRFEFDGDMTQARIFSMSQNDKQRLMHLLKRKKLLHLPSIYTRFFTTPQRGRCMYATKREYIGCTHYLQSIFDKAFQFVVLVLPCLSCEDDANQKSADDEVWNQHLSDLHRLVASINEMSVEFVILIGDSVVSFLAGDRTSTKVDEIQAVLDHFRKDILLVSLAVFLSRSSRNLLLSKVFVPGPNASESTESLAQYKQFFGDDYHAFWFGASKFIILNSSLYISQKAEMIAMRKQQEDWFQKEVENGRLCAREVYVVSYHTIGSNKEMDPVERARKDCNAMSDHIRLWISTTEGQSKIESLPCNKRNDSDTSDLMESVFCRIPTIVGASIHKIDVSLEETTVKEQSFG
uniref:3phosphoinositidedependent protein kinase putative n=1 Tax=Albugo laibachii Nc14 TaxID=890382 RepID=F0WUK3_9STRA|nr:3phosphoinositidedependent protein kinase putative [Albugo laibachii Nc14]|eukprot:CCA25084.1 3phosphoinositidedependent protein kinase putative [Albugo laibachii Nc14]